MSIIIFEKKHIGALWVINALGLLLMLAATSINDANGRLPGLSETPSRAAFIGIVASGLVTDGLVALLDKNGKRRAIAVAIALVYLLMLIPLLC